MSDVLVTPAFVSSVPDSGDTTKLGPSAWNAARAFSGGVNGDVPVRNTGSATGAAWINPDNDLLAIYDYFPSHADGALSGVAPVVGSGAWSVAGASPPIISGGRLICNPPGSTGYAMLDAGATPSIVGFDTVWTTAADLTASNMACIVSIDAGIGLQNMVHFVCGPRTWTLQFRADGGSFDVIANEKWPFPMRNDGTTVYRIGYALQEDTITIFGPNGYVRAFTDMRMRQLRGPRVIWEPIQQVASSSPQLVSVFAFTHRDSAARPVAVPPYELGAATGRLFEPLSSGIRGAANSVGETTIGPAPISAMPSIRFGASILNLRLLASIAIGATTFQTDEIIPAGSTVVLGYGTNAETRTTTLISAGASSPYTTTISVATAKAHSQYDPVSVTLPAGARAQVFYNYTNGFLNFEPIICFQHTSGVFFGSGLDTLLKRLGANRLGLGADDVFTTGLNTTANRPTAANAGAGGQFYDTTLSKPIWSDGTNWRDAAGTIV